MSGVALFWTMVFDPRVAPRDFPNISIGESVSFEFLTAEMADPLPVIPST
jgi:hypothetical protein